MNTLEIRDPKLLNAVERRVSLERELEIRENPPDFHPDAMFLQDIHFQLFQDIYPWAGEFRDVDIAKGQLFCRPELIQSELDGLFDSLKKDLPAMQKMSSSQLSVKMAYYMGELNAIHPFREGNGRTQRLFMESMARELGKELTFPEGQKRMVEASQQAFMKNYSKMESIFSDALGVTRQQEYTRV